MKKANYSNPESINNMPVPIDISKVSFFGHTYKYQVNCHDINKTIIFTNDTKSERITKIARPHGATLIEFELFE